MRSSRMYLSIDIGTKNLGYAVFDLAEAGLAEAGLEFGLYNIEEHLKGSGEIVVERCKVIKSFFKSLNVERFDGVIIERQVNNNVVAMNLMYAIASEALNYTSNVIIFAPLKKFKTFGIKYSTKKKEHKKLSVEIAGKLLITHFPELCEVYRAFKKKDDIADAINQLFTVLYQQKVSNITLQTP